jgi:chromosome partitioning protein
VPAAASIEDPTGLTTPAPAVEEQGAPVAPEAPPPVPPDVGGGAALADPSEDADPAPGVPPDPDGVTAVDAEAPAPDAADDVAPAPLPGDNGSRPREDVAAFPEDLALSPEESAPGPVDDPVDAAGAVDAAGDSVQPEPGTFHVEHSVPTAEDETPARPAETFHVEPPGTGGAPGGAPAADAGADAVGVAAQPPARVLPEVAAVAKPMPLPPRPVRPLPRTMAVANQKGGVGKTTTAVNLGAALAELGYRTLVVDLDPQGNATTGLGINARSLKTSVYDVLMRELPVEDAVEPTSVRNLFVVPATIDLAGAEIELVPAFSRELRLKRALDGVADDFDFTLIDCPPSLGLLTVNALAAATEVIVPVQCEYYALEGLSALLRNVQLVQTNLNRALEMSTIILTMYDARTKLAEQVANEVRTHFGNVVCRQMVPRTVRLSEAPSFGQPIIVFDPSSRGAIAYRELAKEVSGGAPQRVG